MRNYIGPILIGAALGAAGTIYYLTGQGQGKANKQGKKKTRQIIARTGRSGRMIRDFGGELGRVVRK